MTTTTFRIDGIASYAARLWRCRPWNTNPLMRWPDRVLAAARVCAVALMVISVPIAGAVGTVTYSDAAADIRAERAALTVVHATVLETPERTPDHTYQARVSWPGESGPVGATVAVARETAEGASIPLWLNESSTPVAAPGEPAAAVMNGIGAAAVVLVGAAFGGWCLTFLAERLVARRRSVVWERQWSALDGVGTEGDR
ncbi:Rv1733c family protein [Nocardia sp. MW-W600-9]